MSNSEDLLTGVLQLPAAERARLAHGLLLSLEEEPASNDVDEAWAAEIRHRLADIRSGRAKMFDWDEVRDEIQRELDARATL